MNWSRKRTLITGLTVIVVTNAVALAGVAYNRGGEPASTLKLTERELKPPHIWAGKKENSGLALNLQWRVLGKEGAKPEPYGWAYARRNGSPEWMGKAKMTELGFDVSLSTDESRRGSSVYHRQLPRDVLLVLELDGPAYRESLRRAEALPGRNEIKVNSEALKSATRTAEDEAHHNSRLFAVDAGLDAAPLRTRYPDRTRYAIVGGQIRPRRFVGAGDQYAGQVVGVHVDELSAPLALHGAFEGAGAEGDRTQPRKVKYDVTVAFGQRLEPWIVSAQRTPQSDGTETAARNASPPIASSATPTAPSEKAIEVWFAGNPHRAGEPSATVSSRILDTARMLGYSVKSRGHHAADFLPQLLKAVEAENTPDIIFVDNYMHVEGGKTALGSFDGMQSDARLRSRLLKVDEALADLGRGWAFLIAASPDHAGAGALVAELSGCPTPLPTPSEELLRTLQLQAEAAARDFLQCSHDPLIYDPVALTPDCAKRPTALRRVTVCRITAASKLALVETAAEITGDREVGRRSIVSVHRLVDGWRLLAVSGDPLSSETARQWRELAARFGASDMAPAPALLQTPDGVLPSPPPGERYGDFTWLPAKDAAIGQVVEMNYGNDTQLFLVGPTESRLSTGKLWTTDGTWRWRVWTVGADGALALSETRSFQH